MEESQSAFRKVLKSSENGCTFSESKYAQLVKDALQIRERKRKRRSQKA